MAEKDAAEGGPKSADRRSRRVPRKSRKAAGAPVAAYAGAFGSGFPHLAGGVEPPHAGAFGLSWSVGSGWVAATPSAKTHDVPQRGLYENVYIGGFIYALGFRAGRKYPRLDPLAAINLYQQTPYDQAIGDLFASLSGKSLVVEFKRERGELTSELKKPQRESLIGSLGDDALSRISRLCHFVGFGESLGEAEVTLGFVPYADLASSVASGAPSSGQPFGLNAFLDAFLGGSLGVGGEDFRKYLVSLLANRPPESGGISGLLVNFDQKAGIQFFAFDDIQTVGVRISELQKAPAPAGVGVLG